MQTAVSFHSTVRWVGCYFFASEIILLFLSIFPQHIGFPLSQSLRFPAFHISFSSFSLISILSSSLSSSFSSSFLSPKPHYPAQVFPSPEAAPVFLVSSHFQFFYAVLPFIFPVLLHHIFQELLKNKPDSTTSLLPSPQSVTPSSFIPFSCSSFSFLKISFLWGSSFLSFVLSFTSSFFSCCKRLHLPHLNTMGEVLVATCRLLLTRIEHMERRT